MIFGIYEQIILWNYRHQTFENGIIKLKYL
jgi:hypothetical protein